MDRFFVQENDFFYSRGNTPELVALAGVAIGVREQVVFPDLLTRVRFDEEKILPKYAVCLFNSKIGREYFGRTPQGASPTMVKVSQGYMAAFKVPFMGDLPRQREIVARFDHETNLLRGLQALANKTTEEMTVFLRAIWG